MNPIVLVENLSKQYRLGSRGPAYATLRETIVNTLSAPLKRLQKGWNGSSNDTLLWALKDVEFEIEPGEVVGIVGRNGAGKSTLLKVLARITEPTTGSVRLYGRVGSLLEVGTGFHPELTGRENIYLNGAILGMRKAEIAVKFDEIVAFAELERFLDTPVKYYSSGMYMRMAFAVAAHLEPEILLVDEVLAVGDAVFQKKCIGKMGDVAKEGRTVLFVSHNMVAVQSLCNRVIWLNGGEVIEDGPASSVVTKYLSGALMNDDSLEKVWEDIATAPGNDIVRLHKVTIRPEAQGESDLLTMQAPFVVEIEYWNLVPEAQVHITLHLRTEQEIIAFTTGSAADPAWRHSHLPTGLFRSICYVPGNLLNAGLHHFDVLVVRDLSTVIFQHNSALTFEIVDASERQGWFGKEPGVVQPDLKWRTEHLSVEVPSPLSS